MKLNKSNLQDVVVSTLIAETPAMVFIEDYEVTKSSGGQDMLKLTYRLFPDQTVVREDDHDKPIPSEQVAVYDNILLEPSGGMTQEIIDRKLKLLAVALGQEDADDLTTESLDYAKAEKTPLKVLIKVRAGRDGYAPSNTIGKFYPAN